MSMFHGRRIPEVDVTDASAGTAPSVLLDVREADEWNAGHAPSAHWIPLGELERARMEVPINRRVVCVCRSGVRSARAAEALIGMGFNAVNMAGGMKAWAEQDLPVVRDDGGEGQVI